MTVRIYTYGFLSEFYSFSPNIQSYDPFWVNFCLWYEVGIQLYSFVCEHLVVLAPFVEKSIFFPPLNLVHLSKVI